MKRHTLIFLMVLVLALAVGLGAASAHDGGRGHAHEGETVEDAKGLSPAQQGMPSIEGPFPAENMEFLGQVTNDEMGINRLIYTGASFLSDLWGWTSPSGNEYALVGTNAGVAFIRITDPANPVYLGTMPTPNPNTQRNWWWEIRTYNSYAYIVTEVVDAGIGIIDLTQLDALDAVAPGTVIPAEFAFYRPAGYRAAHTININEDTGYAYLAGITHTAYPNDSLLIFDLDATPTAPALVGAITGIYSHDAQVVTYHGPDADYQGHEILVVFQGIDEVVGIYDVTDKNNILTISITSYPGAAFTHQGWLTEDQAFLFVGDEEDELFGISDPQNQDYPDTARTYMLDVRDLDAPSFVGVFDHDEASIDHNMFVKGNYLYQANYTQGVSVLEINESGGSVSLTEVAWMDTEPRFGQQHMNNGYNIWVGPWGVFPYFDSGSIIASDGLNGLIITRLDLP